MQVESVLKAGSAKRGVMRRFRQCSRGTAALEFAMVSVPFVFLLFSIIVVGLHYFTVSALEYGVTTAARKVRTGEAQKAKLTVKDLRELVCAETAGYLPCNERFVVHIKSGSTFAELAPPVNCMTKGTLTPGPAAGSQVGGLSGAASAAVLITACYHWGLGDMLWKPTSDLLGLKSPHGDMTVISASTIFRTEPYQ